MTMKINFSELFNKFRDIKIVVVGDIMLDIFIEGSVNRINPEAPVPVVDVNNKYSTLGGAANVASNVASLGGKAFLFGFVGEDIESEMIKEMLEQKNIENYLEKSGDTITKTRVIGNGQQVVRFDRERKNKKIFNSEIIKILIKKCGDANMIIISDYAKGAITEELFRTLEVFKSKIIVDPKPENKSLYKDVFLVKPNEKELFGMVKGDKLEEAGMILMKELNSNLLVTRSNKGMALFREGIVEIPTYAKEIYDVIGVGDTVTAALALSISAGASLETAAILGNYAAGVAISKKGVYSVNLNELQDLVSQAEAKIVDLAQLKIFAEDMHNKNKRIVWTNGCFDLLHIGHIKYLKESKKFGDALIVGLNADESVRNLKGPHRPVQSESERAEIIASLGFIDKVIIFPELDCCNYLKELRPDCYVKGGDYNLDIISKKEREIVESYGGNIKFVPFMSGKSTSDILNKIRGLLGEK